MTNNLTTHLVDEPVPVDLALGTGEVGDLDDDVDQAPGPVADRAIEDLDDDGSVDAEQGGEDDDDDAGSLPVFEMGSMANISRARNADGRLTIYTRLIEFGLLRKMTDIVLAKVGMPWHLREEAAQEVHATWANLVAKPEFERSQVANYAYKSGRHAAQKLRRQIGAVVVIPGALFRTGRDSAFMESIGAAVNPRDIEEYKDSIELSVDPKEYATPPQAVTVEKLKARLSGLSLSKIQRRVAEMVLVRGMTAESVALELDRRVAYVERLLNQVTNALMERDARGGRQAGKRVH